MIDPKDKRLSLVPLKLDLMRPIDEQYLRTPWYGLPQMTHHLRRESCCVGRKTMRSHLRMTTAPFGDPQSGREIALPEKSGANLAAQLADARFERDATILTSTRIRIAPLSRGLKSLVQSP